MADFVELVFGYIQGLVGYFTWDNVKFLTAAIGVVWILLALNRKFGLLSFLRELGERLFGSRFAGLKARGEAVSAEKTGDWLSAGLQYDKLGDWEKALDCYEKAEEYHLAGEICVRLSHKDVAAEWFLLSDEKLRAASSTKSSGNMKKPPKRSSKRARPWKRLRNSSRRALSIKPPRFMNVLAITCAPQRRTSAETTWGSRRRELRPSGGGDRRAR